MPVQRFKRDELKTADLIVDAIYEGGRSGNSADDPLHPLIGVSNQGGFRYLSSLEQPRLIVLTSSFNDPDWPDRLDRETGTLTYFGDNKRPGRALHDTPRNGNHLLRNMFNALHGNPPRRLQVPPVLVFGNAGLFRDVVFLGLAVPGTPDLNSMEDLVAIWKIAGGQRFQNYRATLTVLDLAEIPRGWLNDVKNGTPLSENCPTAWKNWVERGSYRPLKAQTAVEHRLKSEQIPDDVKALNIIRTIYKRFKDSPAAFEACAAKIAQLMDKNIVSIDLTRPSRDGGRDAVGLYRIGLGASSISVDFALEAKCYDLNNAVGVREVSRLISRLRHRQFGIIVTTSYVHSQAYRELKEDAHPVIVVSAKDIVDILSKEGICSTSEVSAWLDSNFPYPELSS
jgi:hypothetical protein